jgi:hypothetical protein
MYFDPGFGSMVVQALLAALATCGTLLVLFRDKIKLFFSKKKVDKKYEDKKNG